MRRLTGIISLLVLLAGTLAAQELSFQEMDFSSAHINMAGPDAFYIRAVRLGEKSVSVRVARNSQGAWDVTDVYPEGKNVLPNDVVLDFATIRALDDKTLQIDGVFVGGQAYRGKLQLGDRGNLELVGSIQNGSSQAVNEERAAALRELVLSQAKSDALREAEAQIEELIAERDRAREKNDGLAAENVGLEVEKKQLESQLDEVRQNLTELKQRNDYLQGELDRLSREIGDLSPGASARPEEDGGAGAGASGVAGAAGSGTSGTGATAGAAAGEAESSGALAQSGPLPEGGASIGGEILGRQARQLSDQVSSLQARVSRLEAQVAQLTGTEGAGAAEGGTGSRASDQTNLLEQLRTLRAENEALRAEKEALQKQLMKRLLSGGYITLVEPTLTRTLVSGFSTADVQLGNWSVSAGRAVQRDPDQYFAKLRLPAPQKDAPTLYRFTARSTGEGWVGLGLHLYASGSDKRGYGFGKSVLVWLTRDPEVYKSRATHLQLYRSDDDIHMARTLDSVIAEHIASSLSLDVLYEPETNYVTVAVNGEDKVRYKLWFDINSGVEVALRTLGPAEFSGLTVLTEP